MSSNRAARIVEAAALLALGTAGLGACSGAAPAARGFAVDSPRITPLLVVGIDGATLDLAEPLVRSGRLPVLGSLMASGSVGRLKTIEPTVSPAIWTTVATGKLPEVHGILGFEGVPGQTMSTLPTSQMRRVRAFWNVLSEHGRSVGVVSWWVTWPAEPVRGFMVSDRTTYSRMEAAIRDEGEKPREVHPPEIAALVRGLVRRPDQLRVEDLRRFFPAEQEDLEQRIDAASYRHGDLLPELKYVFQADRSTTDIALALMTERPADVTAVAYYGVDAMSHLAWHFMEPERFPGYVLEEEDTRVFGELIERYYEFVDGMLGELVAAAGPDATVLVFSDHGFGPTGHLPWSGGHGRITPGAPLAPDGLLVLSGPRIKAGVALDRAHVLDLCPTLLALEGLPVARDMPGRVLDEALDPGFLAEVALRSIPTYEVEPRERVAEDFVADPDFDRDTLERLRKLGYVR